MNNKESMVTIPLDEYNSLLESDKKLKIAIESGRYIEEDSTADVEPYIETFLAIEYHVIEESYRHCGVIINRQMLESRSRKRYLVQARQIIHFLSRKYTNLTISSIGEKYYRDHATVIHGCNTVMSLFDVEPEVYDIVCRVQDKIEARKCKINKYSHIKRENSRMYNKTNENEEIYA